MSATESAEPICPTFARLDWRRMISRIRRAATRLSLTRCSGVRFIVASRSHSVKREPPDSSGWGLSERWGLGRGLAERRLSGRYVSQLGPLSRRPPHRDAVGDGVV